MGQWILTDVVFSLWVMCVHKLQQADFNLRLIQERLFVFDDFNSDVFFFLMIVSFANLKKKKTPQMSSWTQLFNFFCEGPRYKKTKKFSDYERRQYLMGKNFVSERQKLFLNFTFRINIGKRWSVTVLPLLQKLARKTNGKLRLGKTKAFVHIAASITGFFPRGSEDEVLKFCNQS